MQFQKGSAASRKESDGFYVCLSCEESSTPRDIRFGPLAIYCSFFDVIVQTHRRNVKNSVQVGPDKWFLPGRNQIKSGHNWSDQTTYTR